MSRRLMIAAATMVLLLAATTALGQDWETLEAFKQLHNRLCDPQRVLSPDEGQHALEALREWNLSASQLDEENQTRLLRTEAYAALVVGDAPQALRKLGQLRQLSPDAPQTLELTYLVAAALADAEAGQRALKLLTKDADPRQRKLLSQRRRWLRRAGEQAPDVEILLEGGGDVSARQRYGMVLVVDFWNTHDVTDECARALKNLRKAYRSEFRVQFVGVNSDSEAKVAQAQSFAEAAGYDWPQHYERTAGRAPITHDAFNAGAPPWTVVIDGDGRVRAVGAATEPAFHYALRAAVVTATGSLAGKRPTADKAERRVADEDLPSDPEAQALLRKARAYLKSGMKKEARKLLEEIIRKYPGTREARDAKDRLGYLP